MFTANISKRMIGIMVTIFIVFHAGNLLAENVQKDSNSLLKEQQKVEGTITKVKDGMVYVQIESGIREFALISAKREGIKSLNAGDRVQLTINQGNEVIEIEKLAEGNSEGPQKRHPMVTGQLTKFDSDKNEVVLKLKNGKSKQYKLKDAAATKMGDVMPGTTIIMEIDPRNGMGMDFEIHS